MIQDPLVSVITPAYNSEQFISDAIESVLAQTLDSFEHLIVDDGSSDRTVQVVERYRKRDDRICLVRNSQSKGAVGARNTAIRIARGRYIAFLDSDDVWYPDKMRKQISLLASSKVALVFSSYDFRREDGTSLSRTRVARSEVSYRTLLGRNFIGCLTAVFDTQIAGKPTMPDIQMRQDWGLWLRILRETRTSALGIKEPLAALRLRRRSLSRNKLLATWYNFQLLHKHERIGALSAAAKVAESSIRTICGQ